MKITFSGKALAIGTALVLAVVAISYVKTSPLCPESIKHASSELCHNVQQNWLSWIRGESRSTQFHFVDFLELLNRLSPSSNTVN